MAAGSTGNATGSSAAWGTFQKELERTSDDDPAVGLTRDRWLKFLFYNLGYGTLQQHAVHGGITVGGTRDPVSHRYGPVPVHLVGANVHLERRTRGVAGAAQKSPYSLVQELLNRSGRQHLWGIVSNGRRRLLLRDSSSMVRQAYLEFDLEGMFEGGVFSDFVVLYLVCHATRLTVQDEEKGPASCWLEQVAGGGHRRRHPRPAPAPRRRRHGAEHPRSGLCQPPGQRSAAGRPELRVPDAREVQTAATAADLPAAVLLRGRGPRHPGQPR